MFYIPLTHNRVAIKTATCLFTNGKTELITYNTEDNNVSRNLVQLIKI